MFTTFPKWKPINRKLSKPERFTEEPVVDSKEFNINYKRNNIE